MCVRARQGVCVCDAVRGGVGCTDGVAQMRVCVCGGEACRNRQCTYTPRSQSLVLSAWVCRRHRRTLLPGAWLLCARVKGAACHLVFSLLSMTVGMDTTARVRTMPCPD